MVHIILYDWKEPISWSALFCLFSLARVTGLCSQLVDLGLSNVCALLSLLELMLNLPALGQMNVGLLLRFLSLPLVGLHLELQLVNQILQPGNVFLVLFSLVGEFFHPPLIFANTLNSICSTSLFSLNLCLQLTHPRFKFLELLLATLHGQVLSLIQAMLQVLNSDLQILLHPLKVSASVLLLLQLLSHHCSISDGLLGLVLCIPCSAPCLCSFSTSASSSRTLDSSFWSCFLPPFMARFSASSRRCCRSLTATSRFFFILSR